MAALLPRQLTKCRVAQPDVWDDECRVGLSLIQPATFAVAFSDDRAVRVGVIFLAECRENAVQSHTSVAASRK